MKTLATSVTDEDIVNGIPGSTVDCPIAKAVIREHPEFEAVQVGGITMVTWELNGGISIAVRWLLDSEARRFVARLDAHREVEPFGFTATEFHGTAADAWRISEEYHPDTWTR